MNIFTCGFNGFYQVPNKSNVINTFCKIDLINVWNEENRKMLNCDVHLSWSFNVFQINNKLYKTGFVNNKPNQIKQIYECCDNNVVKISSSEENIFLLLNNGDILKFDQTEQCKEIGNFVSIESEIQTEDIKSSDYIINISCGSNINVAASAQGAIFNIPTKVHQLKNETIIDICCGIEHALLLTDAGNVYSWGQGIRGQLGHGELVEEFSPRLIEALAGLKITSISAGGWHSAAVSCFGDVYTWGWNEKGQLGLPGHNFLSKLLRVTVCKQSHNKDEYVSVMAIPKLIEFDNDELNVLKVACGTAHTFILTDKHELYSTGWNKYGQLGLSAGYEIYEAFTKVNVNFKLNSESIIKCGKWNTAVITN